MEGEFGQQPLKVCPSCSVASRTDSTACPSCGASYERGRGLRLPALPSRWWIGAAIIVAAFALGYGVTKLVREDGADESGSITFAQGNAAFGELSKSKQGAGITEAELVERLGEEPALTEEQGKGKLRQTCAFYAISDQEGRLWQFCFRDGKLFGANTVQ